MWCPPPRLRAVTGKSACERDTHAVWKPCTSGQTSHLCPTCLLRAWPDSLEVPPELVSWGRAASRGLRAGPPWRELVERETCGDSSPHGRADKHTVGLAHIASQGEGRQRPWLLAGPRRHPPPGGSSCRLRQLGGGPKGGQWRGLSPDLGPALRSELAFLGHGPRSHSHQGGNGKTGVSSDTVMSTPVLISDIAPWTPSLPA